MFHPPEVDQDRNVHSSVKDFEDEIPGYLGNQKFITCLEALSLNSGNDNVLDNLVHCYEALTAGGFFPEKEIQLVRAWVNDIESLERY